MNLEEIRRETAAVKDNLWADALALGRDPKIYLHWTGGGYDADYPDYHFSIHADGSVVQTHNFGSSVAATYMRNSGSVAVALDCGADAIAYIGGRCDLGNYPPTSAQIECLAQVIAVIAQALDVPVDIQHVMTHAEAADNMDGLYPCDPYGPAHTCERWDLAVLSGDDDWMSGGDTIRGKALWYQQQGV